jgi:hypothetical protein
MPEASFISDVWLDLNPTPNYPENERAVRDKLKLVQERVLVRRCEARSVGTIPFGLEGSVAGSQRVRILLISSSELGLHIVCIFGGQAAFQRRSFDWTKRLRREMGERLGVVSGTEGGPDTKRF